MHYDNVSTNRDQGILPQNLYRGLYMRVARKLGVDPSYVSRVARGERNSRQVENALRHEVREISRRLGRDTAAGDVRLAQHKHTSKRLESFVRRNRSWIRQEWLRHNQADHNSRRIKLSPRTRALPVLPLVDEAVKTMKFSLKEIAASRMKAAEQHGRVRRSQKYTSTALVEDYNLIRRCITNLAEKHFSELDSHLLFHDLSQFGEVIDAQMQSALRNFLAVG